MTTDSRTSARPVWVVDFVLLAAIWGASFMFMGVASRELGALPAAGLRVCIATVFLLPLLIHKGLGKSLRQNFRLTLSVGILNSAIPFACFSYALLSISSGLSAILNATVPLFGALIAWQWLGERPSKSRMLGLAIGFAGVTMLAWDKASFKPDANGLSSGWAIVACLVATLCYGISASIAKRYMVGLPSLVSATGSQIGASLLLIPLMLWTWPTGTPSLKAWVSIAIVGVVCTALAYVMFFRLVERAGPSKALSVTFAIPAFAVFYGVLFLGESVTGWMLESAVVIIIGTALSTGLVSLGKRR